MKSPWLALVLLSVSLTAPAFAQDDGLGIGHRGGSVFLEATAGSVGQGAGVLWGGSGGGYIQGHVLGFVARVTALPGNPNLRSYDAVIGPRMAVALPLVRLFVEAGGGMGRVDNYDTAVTPGTTWGAAWRLDAGISHAIFPRVDWRILDVSYGHIDAGTGVSPVIAGTGLTLHIW
jgi:hypothetical protein